MSLTVLSLPPVFFLSGFVLVLAAAGCAALLLLGVDLPSPRSYSKGFKESLLEQERLTAIGLDIRLRDWLTIRFSIAVVGAIIGWFTGIPLLMVGLPAIGFFGVAFFAGEVSATKRLNLESSLPQFVEDVTSHIEQSKIPLDRAMIEMAESSPIELGKALEVLRIGNESMGKRLVKLGDNLRSPLAKQIVALVLVARIISPEAFTDVSKIVLVPVLRKQIQIQREIREAEAYPKGAAVVMGLILTLVLFVLLRLDSFHSFYATTGGQIVLLFAGGMYGSLVWVVGKIIRPPKWLDWDLDVLRKNMEDIQGS